MKKLILTISIILMMCSSVLAQGRNDAFINDWGGNRGSDLDITPGLIIAVPGWELFGENTNTEPLGSGLLIMTALGAGYAASRKLKVRK